MGKALLFLKKNNFTPCTSPNLQSIVSGPALAQKPNGPGLLCLAQLANMNLCSDQPGNDTGSR